MRINAMVCRIIRQFLQDKRTLGLLIVAPMLVLTLMSFVFTDEDAVLNIGVENSNVKEILSSMDDDNDINIMDKKEAEEKFEDKALDAYIYGDEKELNILLNGADNSVIGQLNKNVQEAIKDYMSQKGEDNKAIIEDIESNPMINMMNKDFSNKIDSIDISSTEIESYNYFGDNDMSTIDYIGPLLIGLFIFFFVFLISGVSFLRERTTGTLERLLATPIKRYEIVFGYLIGFGIFTIVQSAIISAFSIGVLKIYNGGSIGLILLISIVIALCALSFGMFVSSYAHNELQVMQFIPIVIVSQVFFCGLFSIRNMADPLQILSKCMPLTYASNALRGVMTCGYNLQQISSDLLVLIGFIVVFAILNIITLKKHRIW
ncbi:MAG: ABC transporter permease [Terrisporobacter othiniensis]|uniref:ABC transporter permease n=1 Tax=Terrisporobacter othiniensis TaxID=1577792 RepID=UPI002907911A|nr:ABC transporter permease [Terrisporobacter othiniensis]MDU6986036.1 ABC transporter permease [Terrisporobacter othiniensis]